MLTPRAITSEDWTLLAPIFAAEGGQIPDPLTATGVIATDDQGVAAFWMVQLCWHAGPLWIRPDHRGTRLWRTLSDAVNGLFRRKGGTGYYSFSGEQRMEHVFTELGYKGLGYKVWAKEVD